MDALPAGTYKFIQKNEKCDRKSMIFVKLTDSALRALNDYLKEPNTSGKTPTIEFTEDSQGGLIEIPASSKGISETETCPNQFKFDLESNVAMQGRQGRFECIKHRQRSKRIRKYGLLTKRLKIHATDDVFETTKNRMAEVEFEQRKICTKEIDLKLETVNYQIKTERNSKLRSSCSTLTPEIKVASQKLTRTRNKILPVSTKLNNPIARRPLKERIIHLLAVRPLRKIELSAILRRDGLRDSDKNLLNSTLMSVATIKDNVYHLLRHMWRDVLEDWPFYSEEEKGKMLQNREHNLLLVINSIPTCSDLSTKNLLLGDRSPSRPGYIKGVDGLPTKRKRISHFSRPNFTPTGLGGEDHETVRQISPSRVTNDFDDIIAKFGLSNSASMSSPHKFNPTLCSELIKPEEPMTCNDSIDRRSASDWTECYKLTINTQSVVMKTEQCDLGDSGTIEKIDTIPSSSFPEGPNFTGRYVTITNTSQRRQYKNDFLEYYNEYMAVNDEVIRVTSEFIQLRKKYRECEKGSPGSLETERQIVEKYYEIMNTDYNIKKERHSYLHNLLTHIKKLVHDYDEKMTLKN